LKDVPEFFEVELGESLLSRTETLGKSHRWLINSTWASLVQIGAVTDWLSLASDGCVAVWPI